MDKRQNCNQFRQEYRGDSAFGDEVLTQNQRAHLDECPACRTWREQIDDIARNSELPQFDVPERLTNNIMTAVEQNSPRPLFGHHGLLLPVGIACAAVSATLMPLDSIEGLGATAVGVAIMFLISLFIRADNSEGMTTEA